MDNNSNGDKLSNCTVKWCTLIEKLHQQKSFCLHTGNMNNYMELKLKRFDNSAEELAECLKLMMKCLPDTQIGLINIFLINFYKLHFSNDGTLLLADKEHCGNSYERDDLKITLKLFMETFEFQHLKDATEAVLKQLETDVIEQLIIAFPPPGSVKDRNIPNNFGSNRCREKRRG